MEYGIRIFMDWSCFGVTKLLAVIPLFDRNLGIDGSTGPTCYTFDPVGKLKRVSLYQHPRDLITPEK